MNIPISFHELAEEGGFRISRVEIVWGIPLGLWVAENALRDPGGVGSVEETAHGGENEEEGFEVV